jgi:ribonuclease-3
MDLSKVQQALHYTFNDERLLRTALVHRSYLNEKDRYKEITEHNERMEFLGDAVLELVVTDYLYQFTINDEGYMTALRAALVNYKTIGEVGNKLGLDTEILLSKGEKEELGHARLTIVADCMEAIIGAIYLDGGYGPCEQFIKDNIICNLAEIIESQGWKDHKTLLQEYTQSKFKITPHYRVLSAAGKDHEKIFQVGVWVGENKIAEGEGRSKQEAETEAAKGALEGMKE